MSARLTFQMIVGGLVASSGSNTGSDEGAEMASPASVDAAQPATLTTRSGNAAGTLTMTNSGHGIVTGQRIDLYWEGGSCFGVTAGTVSGTSIPFTLVQGGDVLPAANTAIIVGIPERVAFTLNGSDISALVCSRASTSVRCYFVFTQLLGVLALAVLNQADKVYVYDGTGGYGPVGSSGQIWSAAALNPLAGTSPTHVWISHANTAAADTGLQAVALKH